MADDAVQLTDLEVIQQFSLAVRGATAPRSEVIAALEADLAYLTSARKAAPVKAVTPAPVAKAAPAPTAAEKAPVEKVAAKRVPAKKAPATKATRTRRG
jgi:hypothetical protein